MSHDFVRGQSVSETCFSDSKDDSDIKLYAAIISRDIIIS